MKKNPKLPNLLIIGAVKSGTTTLSDSLSRNPDIFMSPIKEPYFFCDFKPYFDRPKNLSDYLKLFNGVSDEQYICEASAGYLYCPEAPARIKKALEAPKMIISLRHPSERAWSMYLHQVRDGNESRDFTQAVQDELNNLPSQPPLTSSYVSMGHYKQQLQRYLKLFPKSSLLILPFDLIKTDPHTVTQRIQEFLDLRSNVSLTLEHKNAAFGNRFRLIEKAIQTVGSPRMQAIVSHVPKTTREKIKVTLRKVNRTKAATHSDQSNPRRLLDELYKEDIIYLANEVDPFFETWLS